MSNHDRKVVRTAEALQGAQREDGNVFRGVAWAVGLTLAAAAIVAGATAAVMALTRPAGAAEAALCYADGGSYIEGLQRDYGERPKAMALAGNSYMALMVNDATLTWTILEIFRDGSLCLRGSGTEFAMMPQGEPS